MAEFTQGLTEREIKALRGMSQVGGIYYWNKKTCAALVTKGLARCVVLLPPGHSITSEGQAVLAGLPDRKRR